MLLWVAENEILQLYSYVYDGGKELEEVAKAAYMEVVYYVPLLRGGENVY
jgi:hypothetical protein